MSDPRVVISQARALAGQGRLDHARQLLARALQRSPAHPGLNQLMALIAAREGEHERARFYIDRAIAGDGTHAGLWHTKGLLLTNTPHRVQAEAALRRAVELDPKLWSAWEHLGALLADLDRPSEALEALARVVDPRGDGPVGASAALAYARAASHVGLVSEAITVLRRAIAGAPESPDLQAALCVHLNYVDGSPEEVTAEHRRLGALLPSPPAPPATSSSPLGGHSSPSRRPLRVGLLSPDLREHAVAYFLRALVEHWPPLGCTLVAYSLGAAGDHVTSWVRDRVQAWHSLAGVSDGAIEARIRDDRLDVLIDLAGLSSSPRLRLLARRPAPVVLSAIGYPNTTGIPGVTHRLVDGITDPPGAEALAIESLVRLPECFLCYTPPSDAPEPRMPDGGPIVFGSFNNLAKLSCRTMVQWARALEAVAGSRLLIKARGLEDAGVRDELTAQFALAGVSPDRLDLEPPRADRAEHLAMYARVHVALDPMPYNGTTTTCEAMWMGVPVVTRLGRAHAGRVGASVLRAAGAGELVAESDEAYIEIARSLAADRARLAQWREHGRERMRSSVLCDGPGYARRFDDAVRRIVVDGAGASGA